MFDADTGIHAQLFCGFDCLFGGAALAAFGDEFRDLGIGSLKRLGNRMIGRNADKRRTHQCIRAGGIDVDCLFTIRAFEPELQTARPTNPVRLHQFYFGGPIIKVVNFVQQVAGHIRNLKEPLSKFFAFNRRTGPPAATVDHLFVGQNGHVDRVPVDDSVLSIHEASVQHVDEQRLLLAIVFGIAGREFAAPVDRQTQRLHLGAHVRDVFVGPVLWVTARCHRGVFRRHPKGIPPHRVQHVVARRHFITRHHIAHGVIPHVPHVDAARRIGEHFQHIVFRLVLGTDGFENLGLIPGGLPFGFDFVGGIAGHISDLWDSETPGIGARRGHKSVCGQFL